MCLDHRRGPRTFHAPFAIVLLAIVAVIFTGVRLSAQSSAGDAPRRIKVAVRPEYSALAKRLNLSGTVRVEVLIAPDGKVKKARVVGGHPVLALDAERAAMLTEFEPAAKESTQVLEFLVGPGNN